MSEQEEKVQSQLEAPRREVDIALEEIQRGEAIEGPLAIEKAKAEFRRLTGRL